MNKLEIISALLFLAGMILAIGAVGSLEFAGDTVGVDELRREVVKSIIAAVMMGVSLFVGRAGEEDSNE